MCVGRVGRRRRVLCPIAVRATLGTPLWPCEPCCWGRCGLLLVNRQLWRHTFHAAPPIDVVPASRILFCVFSLRDRGGLPPHACFSVGVAIAAWPQQTGVEYYLALRIAAGVCLRCVLVSRGRESGWPAGRPPGVRAAGQAAHPYAMITMARAQAPVVV